MTHGTNPTDNQAFDGQPPAQSSPYGAGPDPAAVILNQATQRGGLVAVSVVMIVVGALGLLIGLFMPALIGGTAVMISGSVILVGGVLVSAVVSAASWWQFESRQQLGLLAQGLSEQFGSGDHR